MPLRPEDIRPLRRVVREHKVIFDVHPAVTQASGRKVRVGFDVEIRTTHAKHDGGGPAMSAGCGRDGDVWNDLLDIAAAVIPPGDRAGVYLLGEVRRTPSTDAGRRRASGEREDIDVVIAIRHRDGDGIAEVGQWQERCVKEIVASLRSLGAQQTAWRELHFVSALSA